MVRRKRFWVQQSDATPSLKIIDASFCKTRGGEIIGTFFFFKKCTLFGKYKMLSQFSRLSTGSAETYVDVLILLSSIVSCILLTVIS